MRSLKVVVVGGGIGGLALAVALRRRGIGVEVFERARSFGNTGSGVELTPNGVKALDHIDPELGAAVRRTGWSSDLHRAPMPIMSADGKVLKHRELQGFAAKWGAPAVGILRAELHRLLAEAVNRPGLAPVTVHHSLAVVGVETTPDSATARLADGRTVAADVLVGADGVRSTLRATVASDAQPRFLFASVRGIAKRPTEFSDGFVVVGPGGHFFAEAVDGERLFWTATTKAPEGHWPAKPIATTKADLLDLLGGWTHLVPDTIASSDLGDMIATDVHDCPPMERYHSGRVVLLGDAAHPIGPMLGQGANMALEDVARLADLLASGKDVPAALRAYELARTSRANKILQHSRVVAKVGHTTNPVVNRLRDLMIKTVNRDETYRDKELFSYRP
ncbi:FAD-dependent oxidoreductase [Micromonospora sp. SL1-18]|uniref:FAD-dependent oxidoreductase n=1 Tax=Micromonospora sp. SL1-18 TaxID=3399128 RepID=UPI003A4DF175